jgi:hypothetical protein
MNFIIADGISLTNSYSLSENNILVEYPYKDKAINYLGYMESKTQVSWDTKYSISDSNSTKLEFNFKF